MKTGGRSDGLRPLAFTFFSLAVCAGENGLREYSARVALRFADLGDEAAGRAAEAFSRSIENATLRRAVDAGLPIETH